MNKLLQQLRAALPAGITIPEPLSKLYDWIEARGQFVDSATGHRTGLLFPPKAPRLGSTTEFSAQSSEPLGYWFGFTDKRTGKDISGGKSLDVINRLCVFARTGGDGSVAALWRADDGTQYVVHLGSGSGSTLVCVLAENFVDFLRLLAIGYDEICWNSEWPEPPDTRPNVPFRNWVTSTFGVDIPRTAGEIVKTPAEMDERDSNDLFWKWTKAHAM